MKSIWLAVSVFSVVLAKAESCGGFGYELVMNGLENLYNQTRYSEHDLRSVTTKMSKIITDEHLSTRKGLVSVYKDLKSTGTKVLDGQSQLADHTKRFEAKLDQLIDLSIPGEPSCPENAADGVYKLKPAHSSIPAFSVYCEDGWIVIHRRFNGSLDFNQNWVPYREGFGDLQGEHWLGLEKMHQITRVGSYELKVILKSFNDSDVVKTAKYNGFRIGSEIEQYQLNLEQFAGGDAGDNLNRHNTMKFSTLDRRNDILDASETTCAETYKSGWWFSNCYHANLNGFYEKGNNISMSWFHFNRNNYCLKEARMVIRAVKPNN